jgi:hypothetical protein
VEDYLLGSVAPAAPPAPASGTDAGDTQQAAATGPLKAPELRAEYAKVKKRAADLEKELTELKAKSAAPKPVDDGERTA